MWCGVLGVLDREVGDMRMGKWAEEGGGWERVGKKDGEVRSGNFRPIRLITYREPAFAGRRLPDSLPASVCSANCIFQHLRTFATSSSS